MSVAQRPLLDNPFRPAPTEDQPLYPSCYVAPVGAAYRDPPRSTARTNTTQSEQPVDISAEIAKKNQLYAAARASGSPQDWDAFKRQRCRIGKLIRESRKGKDNGKGKRGAFKTDFYCDACERGFADGVELSAHLSEHVSCEREGCAFQACPQLVSLHVKLQHDTELIRRGGPITEEDAAEWRRQRRLRYPTLRNIEAKKAVQAELQARREVMGCGPEKRFPARRPKRKRQARKSQRFERQQVQSNKSVVVVRDAEAASVAEPAPRALSPFRGVGTAETRVKTEPVDEEDKLRITDSESDAEARPVEAAAAPALGGALGSLMACYGSDSDEEPVTKRVVTETPVAASLTADSVTNSSQPVAVPPSAPGGTATTASAPPEAPTNARASAPSKSAPTRQRRGKPPCPAPVPTRRLTLLQKLLASEMRHERNIVLQCVHHVVRNNFFFGQVSANRGAESPEFAPERTATPLDQCADQTTTMVSEKPTSDLATNQCPDPASKQSTDKATNLSPEQISHLPREPISHSTTKQLLSEQPPKYEVMKLPAEPSSECSKQSSDPATSQMPELTSEQSTELTSEQSTDKITILSLESTPHCSEQTSCPGTKPASMYFPDEPVNLSPESNAERALQLCTVLATE